MQIIINDLRATLATEVSDFINYIYTTDFRSDLENIIEELAFRGDLEKNAKSTNINYDYDNYTVNVEVQFYNDITDFDINKIIIDIK